jgi:quinol-cytochrome oxidoreductase complex cytochrome b subunit
LGKQVLLQNFSGDLAMNKFQRYRLSCTLSFGDIYGQIIIWLLVIFASLAAAMGLMGASRPIYALATVGLILVLSLPFLLFAFVTTLLNHIEVMEIDPVTQSQISHNEAQQARAAAI